MRVEKANRTVGRDLWLNRVCLQRVAARWLLALAGTVTCAVSGSAAMTPVAAAQDSTYCEQVHARAASDAALLVAPRLILQELRFPRNNQLDTGIVSGQGLQFRAGLSFSLVELFKGLATLDVGDAACREHEAKVALRDRIHHSRDYARMVALQAQSDYLNQHKNEWAQLGRKAAERMSRHLITLVDFTKLNQLINELDQKLADVEGKASALKAQLPALSHGTLSELTEEYRRQNARYEHEMVSARALDSWQVRVTGGVIAQAPIDWYGQAEVSFSFGALVRPKLERRYERAHAAELAWSPDELPAQARELRNQHRIEADQAKRELAVAQRSLATVLGAGSVLANIEAENVQHARDVLTIERYSAESEVVFLQNLIDGLTSETK